MNDKKLTITNLLNTTRKGCNYLVIIADWLSDYSDDKLYAFMFKRADLKTVEDNFDVYFTYESVGAWAGIKLTSRGKKALRDLIPNRYLFELEEGELEKYRQENEKQTGTASERCVCAHYSGYQLPLEEDLNCRDIKIKLGKHWIIAQVKKMDSSITANVHK